MAKISLKKRIDATKLHPRTMLPLAGPEVNIPFGALVESIGGDYDRVKFLFLGEPYSARREIFVDAIEPHEAAKLPAAGPAAPPAKPEPAAVPVEPIRAAAPGAKQARLKFEPLEAGDYSVARAKVPGGWLVVGGNGVTFYPDPKHQWDGSSVE
ncbi:MAG: hypothetical protein ACLQKA_06285 [Bryobacteraceae bacterium]